MKKTKYLILLSLSFSLYVSCKSTTQSTYSESELESIVPSSEARLIEAPELKHYVTSVENGSSLTVDKLVEGRGINFTKRPDSSPLGDQVRSFNSIQKQKISTRRSHSLKILSYNVGLLYRKKFLGTFSTLEVPKYHVRRNYTPDAVMSKSYDYDIIFLQELWDMEDIKNFKKAADQRGYILYYGSDKEQDKHGLAILVNKKIHSTTVSNDETFFREQYIPENFPGPGMKRAYLSWEFTTNNGQTFKLFNVHLTAFSTHWKLRNSQAREVGEAINKTSRDKAIFVGGDFNGSAFYQENDWQGPEEKISDWWHNTISYHTFLYFSRLKDAFVADNGLVDVRAANRLPMSENAQKNYTKKPYGSDSYCSAIATDIIFSATDCNRLHFENYAGEEFPSRMDLVMYRSSYSSKGKSLPVVVEDAKMVFTERYKFSELEDESDKQHGVELSDHYGVHVDFRVAID